MIAQEPILASWKVSEVLARYPRLLDVFVEASPTFGHLRNPLVRSVRARLVTVAQAERVAGLTPGQRVVRLNEAAGLTPVRSDTPTESAESEAPPDALIAEELDVCPMLGQGEEPYSAVMLAARRVPVGEALRLVAPFEPVPLYGVLADRGFLHRTRRIAPDAWEVLFVRAEAKTEADAVPARSHDEHQPADATLRIDVSERTPPEPMI